MTTAAYNPSTVKEQAGAAPWSRSASAHLKVVEITQPNDLALRFKITTDANLTCYCMTTNPTAGQMSFFQYYQEKLYGYLEKLEQIVAEKSGMRGKYPVSMLGIGQLLTLLSPQALPAGEWHDGSASGGTPPNMTAYFEPITDTDKKQFSGAWTLDGEYDSNSSLSQDSTKPSVPQYSTTINFDAPCNITFYNFKKEHTADLDNAVEQILNNWPSGAKPGKGPALGAARVHDVLYVTSNADDTEILDAAVEDVLSPYLNRIVAELFGYPGKYR